MTRLAREPASSLAAEIPQAACSYAKTEELADDLTVVVLKVT